MCHWGEASEQIVVELTADWSERLQDVRDGRAACEPVQRDLAGDVEAALETLRRESDLLVNQAKAMVEIFSSTLDRLNESGKALHTAIGDLQHNREAVFRLQPMPSRGTRQLAEELASCREHLLCRVRENGETLAATAQTLAAPHHEACVCARATGNALKQAVEILDYEGELLRFMARHNRLPARAAQAVHRRYLDALEAIQEDSWRLKAAAQDLAHCRKAYRRGIVANRTVIRNAETSLHCDQKAVFGWAWEHVSDVRRGDRNFILAVVGGNGERLEGAPEEFRRDREVVLAAVTQSCGWALQFAAPSLRKDREVVLAAVRRSGWALEHAADEMKRDREVVLAAVQTDGEALEFASEEMRGDREVALAAIRRSGACALHSVAPALRGDREVAEAAVQENGLVLEHVSEALRADRSVVLAAVAANGLALEHAAPAMQLDKAVVTAAVRANPDALQFAAPAVRSQAPVIKAAVERDGQALRFASEDLRRNRSIVMAAVKRGGLEALQYASPPLRGDPKILLVAKEYDMNLQASDMWQHQNPI